MNAQFLLVLVLIIPARMSRASVVPTEWLHNTGVQQFNPFDSEFTPITAVTVPLNTTSNAALGASTASTTYDIQAAADSYISYLMEYEHSCINANSVRPKCILSGSIWFAPETDVTIDFEAEYAIDLSADWMLASLGFGILERLPSGEHVSLYDLGDHADTTLIGPISDVLSIAGAVTLPGDHEYRITYGSSVTILTAPVNSSASGAGAFHIEVTAIPEPASAVGLLACLLLVRRRCPR